VGGPTAGCVMLGLRISFKTLVLQWSSIQWLMTALCVGLGFGLQEIVANFVSGVVLNPYGG
jgi:small-conductance mechanosensitive channel